MVDYALEHWLYLLGVALLVALLWVRLRPPRRDPHFGRGDVPWRSDPYFKVEPDEAARPVRRLPESWRR